MADALQRLWSENHLTCISVGHWKIHSLQFSNRAPDEYRAFVILFFQTQFLMQFLKFELKHA